MLSSGNTSLLSDEIRMQLALLKKNQDLSEIISEHFKKVIIKSRSVVDLKDEEKEPESEQKLKQGLIFHHNIFNWTYQYIDLLRIHGKEIKNQSDDLIKLINMELT